MSEFIGARISLISKSDIKYIGTLHEINSDNHTVALESVTSHGTEGRKGNPAEEVPGSDQIYEYIVFRGSDVKDLTIIENATPKENQAPQVPNDPAILGSQRPPQPPQQQAPPQPPPPQQNQQQQFGYQGPPQPPRFQGPGGPHGFPGQPGAVPGYGFPPPGPHGPPPQGFGMGYGPPPGHGFPHGPPPGQFGPNQHMQGPPGQMNQQRPPQHMHRSPQPPIGSKEGTPQPQDQGQPAQQPPPNQQRAFEMSATPGPGNDSSAGPPPPVASKPSPAAAAAPSAATQSQQPPKGPSKTDPRVAVPLPGSRPPQKPNTAAQVAAAPPPGAAPSPQSMDDATQAATAAVAAAMAKLGPVNQQQQQPANATDNLTQNVAQMRMNDNQQRGRGRGRANYPRGGRRESAHKQIDVPKEDYDFEGANAKFNKQDLVKEAIASGSPVTSPNGEAKDPIANGDANGHAADEDDVVIPPAAKSTEKSYDKKNSFFDNISSDLKDREAAGQMGADRRQERTKNFETFGQGSVDGGRGGFRGRGRGYRGGPRGGYRGDRGRGRGFVPYV